MDEPHITKHKGEVSGKYYWQVNYPDYKERGYKAHICHSAWDARRVLREEIKKLRKAEK